MASAIRTFVKRLLVRRRVLIVGALIVFVLADVYFFSPPWEFPKDATIEVREGKGLAEVAHELKSKNIIRSPFWFINALIVFRGEQSVIAGEYLFTRPLGVFSVAKRIGSGRYGFTPVRITVPEGSSIKDISLILKKTLATFDDVEFLRDSQGKEGYLFPDTYLLMPKATSQDVVLLMEENFQRKIASLQTEITLFGKPVKDVITMASILEREARTTESRQMIAHILWTRLLLGIPLQVDASFLYVNGKSTFDLTLDDLKIDSPYNTYRYRGLPPTPIANPGLDSIKAAITPIKNNYLYFLSDKDGVMHYARTFEEHVENKRKYLR